MSLTGLRLDARRRRGSPRGRRGLRLRACRANWNKGTRQNAAPRAAGGAGARSADERDDSDLGRRASRRRESELDTNTVTRKLDFQTRFVDHAAQQQTTRRPGHHGSRYAQAGTHYTSTLTHTHTRVTTRESDKTTHGDEYARYTTSFEFTLHARISDLRGAHARDAQIANTRVTPASPQALLAPKRETHASAVVLLLCGFARTAILGHRNPHAFIMTYGRRLLAQSGNHTRAQKPRRRIAKGVDERERRWCVRLPPPAAASALGISDGALMRSWRRWPCRAASAHAS